MTKPKKGTSSTPTKTVEITLETLFDNTVVIDSKMENIATKECISNLTTIINDQNEIIGYLEDKVTALENHVSHLMKENDEVAQYQRRLCL